MENVEYHSADREMNFLSDLLAEAWHLGKQWKYRLLTFIFLAASATVLLFPHDKSILSFLIAAENSPTEDIARALSLWGDFQTGTLIVTLGVWLVGKFLNKEYWRRIAIACLLAASFAGITTNCISFAVGRPRPYMNIEDAAYGFRKDYTFHSFPSGHSTTAFGTATVLAVSFPPAAVPSLAAASAIAWSRLNLNRHYPTDVVAGSAIGILFGILFGAAARRLTRGTKLPPSPNSSAQN